MDEVIARIDGMSTSAIRDELRQRRLNDSGYEPDIQNRLIASCARDFTAGWTMGDLLDTRSVPFNGEGRNPQELVGRHLKRLIGNANGTVTLELSDAADRQVLLKSSGEEVNDGFPHLPAVRVLYDNYIRESFCHSSGKESPHLIVEATMGLRRKYHGGPTFTVIGIKCEGMKTMKFFWPAGNPMGYVFVVAIRGVLLLEEMEKPIHEDILREELLLPESG
ncbi:hypothetical protein IMSHALPRED_002284 [Imshaugia aleurites]|uniref:Uncharacterized protein n=1 Tax=Imshaugia aleurites TaxID=172621 RepID=A0A8H3I4R6_9LECA|nr:hypothetical protein IMSHALPRED_002284 [Imshaugia aleurites]